MHSKLAYFYKQKTEDVFRILETPCSDYPKNINDQ